MLANPDNTDAQNTNVSPTGFGFTNTSWAGQTFTPTVTGQLKRVDVELFCAGCTATSPNITVSIRATTGATPVPTGADLATATIPGFNDGGAGGLKTFTFASPVTLTAGTRYAFVFRLGRALARGTVRLHLQLRDDRLLELEPVRERPARHVDEQRLDLDGRHDGRRSRPQLRHVHQPGLRARRARSSRRSRTRTRPPGRTPTLDDALLHGDDARGHGRQVPGRRRATRQYGPFNFVGPDGTASTFFTTSGASLSQFNGFRYLRYKAFLSTTNSAVTPSLSSVQVCFVDTAATSATSLAVAAATGTFGGTTTLSRRR